MRFQAENVQIKFRLLEGAVIRNVENIKYLDVTITNDLR